LQLSLGLFGVIGVDVSSTRYVLIWFGNMYIISNISSVPKLQDHLHNSEQRIISWKPPSQPAFKININDYQSEDITYVVGVAITRGEDFKWSLGITGHIISYCVLEIFLATLKEALI